jgi:hypothetical protein
MLISLSISKLKARTILFGGAALLAACAQYSEYAQRSEPPVDVRDSANIELLGYNDLQGREALQTTVLSDVEGGNGEYVYVGFHAGQHLNPQTGEEEFNGTMIIDIADPANPQTITHIANPVLATSRAVQVVYDYGPEKRDYLIRNHETDVIRKFEIFDITGRDQTPVVIRKVGEITGTPENSCGEGCGGTLYASAHKGWWSADTGLYYAAANEPGFRVGRDSSHLIIWNLSDPSDPQFIGRGWIDGQKMTEVDPGEELNLHHPIVDEARGRLFGGYHRGGDVLAFDISDLMANASTPQDPPIVWHIDAEPPLTGGAHTVAAIDYAYPDIPNMAEQAYPRTYVLVTPEAERECLPARTKLLMLDVTYESNPLPVSTWQVPDGDYCERGGRFGAHQYAETVNGEINTFDDKLVWLSYFNAGIRILDISNPYQIEEVAHFVPHPNSNPDRPSAAIQMNDVDIDHRGLAYAVDREGAGMYVLKYSP